MTVEQTTIVREYNSDWMRSYFVQMWQRAVTRQTAAELARVAEVERALADFNNGKGST
jgi:hypothetical protein